MSYKQFSPIPIISGGSNATSFATTDGTVYYDGTRLVTTATGTAGQVLTSNGAGVAPTYQTTSSGSITITGDTGGPLTSASFTFTAGTTGLSFDGAGTTETLSGTLVVANGGTGAITFTTNGSVYFDGAILNSTAAGTTGQVLTGVTGSAPTFQDPAASSISLTGNTGGALTGNAFSILGGDGSSQINGSGTTLSLSFSDASANTFIGNDAGNWPTSLGGGATFNTGTGLNSLLGLTTGVYNSGHGSSSLFSLTDGTYNTGCGGIAGGYLGTGAIGNTAVGYRTFTNVNGDLVTGAYNIAIGANAGSGYHSTESSNILIGAYGVITDQTTTRIGYINGTASTQTACYIDGITGATVTGAAVLIDATGLLGTVPSSRKFKDDIVDMNDSEVLHKLRPVNFTYKSDATKHRQWGVIAEEVEEVCPDLVLRDEHGDINTVRYLDMIPMLLNEVQKLRKELNTLKGL